MTADVQLGVFLQSPFFGHEERGNEDLVQKRLALGRDDVGRRQFFGREENRKGGSSILAGTCVASCQTSLIAKHYRMFPF